MLRKITIVLISVAAIGALALPTDVSARGHSGAHSAGHFVGGYRGGYHGGFRGVYRGYGYPYVGAYGPSCWRYLGFRRVWVCGGYGYPFY